MENLRDLYCEEINASESTSINGGDKAMRDLGYALGRGARWLMETIHYVMEVNEHNPAW